MKKEKNNEMWTFSWEMWKYPSSLWDKKSGLFHLCCFQLRAICRDRLLMLSQGFLIQHCSILLVYKCVCHAPTIRQIFLKQNKNRSLSQQISLSQQLLFWWGEAAIWRGEECAQREIGETWRPPKVLNTRKRSLFWQIFQSVLLKNVFKDDCNDSVKETISF